MTDPAEQLFALCSFRRVFDVEPKQELLTLGELLRFTSRFEVKPQVLQRMRKAVAKVERSFDRVIGGSAGAGPWGTKMREAMREAERVGADPVAAARRVADGLANDARQGVKRDLKLWSPALYKPGARRGTDGVIHISCLVLDYDGGTTIEEASRAWQGWLHVAHSTWSFTEAHHKFRVVLPLAHPVRAEDWEAVWNWGAARAGGPVDPSGKGVASTFAIPTVGAMGWPRRCIAQPGRLLDPMAEHLVSAPAEPPPGPPPVVAESLVVGAAKYTYIAEPLPDGIADLPEARGVTPRWEDDGDWDAFGGTESPSPDIPRTLAHPENEPRKEPGIAPADEPREDGERAVIQGPVSSGSDTEHAADAGLVRSLREALELAEARASKLQAQLDGTSELRIPVALERVAALHREGVLDEVEFDLAKRSIIEDEA